MSIKRNNKQIAGNYVNFNMEVFNSQINAKIDEMNAIYNSVIQFAQSMGTSVGSERIWRGETIPDLYLEMNGQIVNVDDYPALYEWVVENNLIVDFDVWDNDKLYGLYSFGEDMNTFRLPNMSGLYCAGYDSSIHTGLSKYQDDTLPNLSGTIDIAGTNDSSPTKTSKTSGVFKTVTKDVTSYPITGSTTLTKDNIDYIELDISQAYNTSDRVQPKTIPVKYIVCYKNIWENT